MKIVRNLLTLLLAMAVCRAETVDRMVAVVNRQVILQSELEQAAHVEFLLGGRPLTELTSGELQAVLDRLIDQALLQQQIVDRMMLNPTADEVAARLAEVREQIPGASADDKWKQMLAVYAVTQQDVEMQIASQLRILRFVDLRFRTLAHVDNASISNYYQEKLLPELRKQGAPEPPLAQVSGKIERILTEQRIDELLTSWLQTLRSQAHIRRMDAVPSSASGSMP